MAELTTQYASPDLAIDQFFRFVLGDIPGVSTYRSRALKRGELMPAIIWQAYDELDGEAYNGDRSDVAQYDAMYRVYVQDGEVSSAQLDTVAAAIRDCLHGRAETIPGWHITLGSLKSWAAQDFENGEYFRMLGWRVNVSITPA